MHQKEKTKNESEIFLKKFASVSFDVFSLISQILFLTKTSFIFNKKLGEQDEKNLENFEKSAFNDQIYSVYRSVGINQIMLREDESTVKSVIRFVKYSVPLLVQGGVNIDEALDVFLCQMDRIKDKTFFSVFFIFFTFYVYFLN